MMELKYLQCRSAVADDWRQFAPLCDSLREVYPESAGALRPYEWTRKKFVDYLKRNETCVTEVEGYLVAMCCYHITNDPTLARIKEQQIAQVIYIEGLPVPVPMDVRESARLSLIRVHVAESLWRRGVKRVSFPGISLLALKQWAETVSVRDEKQAIEAAVAGDMTPICKLLGVNMEPSGWDQKGNLVEVKMVIDMSLSKNDARAVLGLPREKAR